MSLETAVAEYLADRLDGDVFPGVLPAKLKDASDQWAVIADGGEQPTGGNNLTWRQVCSLRVLYRHVRRTAFSDADGALRDAFNAPLELSGLRVLGVAVSPMSNTDDDASGRHTASWTVQVTLLIDKQETMQWL